MSSVHSDPIREILNQTRGKDCSIVDLLIQSISLCIGFYFLDEDTIRSLQSGAILQKDFENIVAEYLQKTKPKTAASFRAFSQVRLLEDTFQQLFLYWAQFSKNKNKLRRLVERLIYPNLIRYYRADLMVPTWLERFAVDLLPIADGIFYDGTAGAGGVAIGLAKYGQEKECDIQVFTKEIDSLLFHLSILRSQMHGLEFRQANEDCIQDSQLLAKGKANMSIMFPPLRGGGPPVYGNVWIRPFPKDHPWAQGTEFLRFFHAAVQWRNGAHVFDVRQHVPHQEYAVGAADPQQYFGKRV